MILTVSASLIKLLPNFQSNTKIYSQLVCFKQIQNSFHRSVRCSQIVVYPRSGGMQVEKSRHLKPSLKRSNHRFAAQWARTDNVVSLGTSKGIATPRAAKRRITSSSPTTTRMGCFDTLKPCSHRKLASNILYQLLWCLLR